MSFLQVNVSAEVCFNLARMMLNDTNQQLWSDNILMPMMLQAHLELQQFLKSRACPIMKDYEIITLDAYQTQLPGVIGNMVAPIQLWERPSGSQADFTLMTETDTLPVTPDITNILTYWMWYQQLLYFAGATIDTDILIFYWARLAVPTASTELIGIIDGEQYLGPRIAALAAGSVGEEQTSSIANALAQTQLQVVLQSNRSRAPQGIGSSLHP